jgi:hypothetical protein
VSNLKEADPETDGNIAKLRSALATISADLPEEDWKQILMAIAALPWRLETRVDIADEWSQTALDRYKYGKNGTPGTSRPDIEGHIRRFAKAGREGITEALIYKKARATGWKPPPSGGTGASPGSETAKSNVITPSVFDRDAVRRQRERLAGNAAMAREPAGQAALARPALQPSTADISRYVWDGDPRANVPLRMLVKDLLPAEGIAFAGGQSRVGKTFGVIYLAVALATGKPFFGCAVQERVGVVYVAGEGFSNFGIRLKGAKQAAGVTEDIPVTWVRPPDLTKQAGVNAFITELQAVGQVMEKRFGVRLGVVVIDTLTVCLPMKSETGDEAHRVCNIMRPIGLAIGATVIPVHHYGKDPSTGLRGPSTWTEVADVILSFTGDISLTGEVSNRLLSLAKAREGETRVISPFRLDKTVVTGAKGADGGEVTTGIVVPTERVQPATPRGEQAMTDFTTAVRRAIGRGADVKLRGGGSVRAGRLDVAREEFAAIHVTGGGDDEKAKKEALKKAWQRAFSRMPAQFTTGKSAADEDIIWSTGSTL